MVKDSKWSGNETGRGSGSHQIVAFAYHLGASMRAAKNTACSS